MVLTVSSHDYLFQESSSRRSLIRSVHYLLISFFEYPNDVGVRPLTLLHWDSAARTLDSNLIIRNTKSDMKGTSRDKSVEHELTQGQYCTGIQKGKGCNRRE